MPRAGGGAGESGARLPRQRRPAVRVVVVIKVIVDVAMVRSVLASVNEVVPQGVHGAVVVVPTQ